MELQRAHPFHGEKDTVAPTLVPETQKQLITCYFQHFFFFGKPVSHYAALDGLELSI